MARKPNHVSEIPETPISALEIPDGREAPAGARQSALRAYMEGANVSAAARIAGVDGETVRRWIAEDPELVERSRLASMRRTERGAREAVEIAQRRLRRQLADPGTEIGPSMLSRIIVEQSIVEQRAAAASGEQLLPGDLDGLRGLELAERLESEARKLRDRARIALDADPAVHEATARPGNPLLTAVNEATTRAGEGAAPEGGPRPTGAFSDGRVLTGVSGRRHEPGEPASTSIQTDRSVGSQVRGGLTDRPFGPSRPTDRTGQPAGGTSPPPPPPGDESAPNTPAVDLANAARQSPSEPRTADLDDAVRHEDAMRPEEVYELFPDIDD